MSAEIPSEVQQVAQRFLHLQQTLSLAESCTGGLISALVAAVPGVSKFFEGSVISYAGRIKRDQLGVPDSLIRTMGEVSESVALAMARGVRQRMATDWSLSVTGIAGPTGGTPDKPVGTVCFAVCGPGIEEAIVHRFSAGERQEIQRQSALFALQFLLDKMPKEPKF